MYQVEKSESIVYPFSHEQITSHQENLNFVLENKIVTYSVNSITLPKQLKIFYDKVDAFKNAKHWNLHEQLISLPSFALENKIRKPKWVTEQSGFVEKQEEIKCL